MVYIVFLLFAVSGGQRALSVFEGRNLRLERGLAPHIFKVHGFFHFLFAVVIFLSDDKSLLDLGRVGLIFLLLLFGKFLGSEGHLRLICELFAKILLLNSPHKMLLLLVLRKFILTIGV